ncbi:lamin tail domain-containing protein 2, partial [Sturnira hondurensis]|uniref:lamin tail domain-containing protein 2 n=1 Tax=Sturnira hondurensis TaxID=192404 RepID=UPI0018798D8A
EIRALRGAIQGRQDARHHRILQEVAGLPLERGPHSQDKFLQTQVQKLTLELKEQKERAQLERERLEGQLLRTQAELQQREAELQALHKSCLVKLAHSSWVGRMLRSSTGSVEVVTAETLMDPSDSSESDEAPPAREGFRLEDVDWNTIAHRYPNLLANIKPNSDYKHPWPRAPPQPPVDSLPDACGPESCGRRHRLKSVEWGSLPFVDPDNSRGADSESSSWRLDEHLGVQKVTGHPPRLPGHISFQHIAPPARSFSRDLNAEPEGPREQGISPDSCETHSDQPGKAEDADLHRGTAVHPWSKTASCLKVVAVSLSKGFVCIFNESAEETADLGGFTLQQLAGDFPTCTCRFPPHTLLEPQHHITVRPTHLEPARPHPLPEALTRARHSPQVWGEGPGCTKKQPPSSVGREPVHFHPSPSFVTLLLSPKGEVLSKYQAPHCPIPASRIFEEADLSIDRFPLPEARPGAQAPQQRRPLRLLRRGRRRETRAQGWKPRTQALSTCLTASKLISPQEVPAPPERVETDKRVETDDARELLPAIAQDRLSLTVYQSKMEPTVRVSVPAGGAPGVGGLLLPPWPAPRPASQAPAPQVCRKSVDRGCPMVALSAQSRAKGRFCLPGGPPITVDACRRV